jgi:hypothetical protein
MSKNFEFRYDRAELKKLLIDCSVFIQELKSMDELNGFNGSIADMVETYLQESEDQNELDFYEPIERDKLDQINREKVIDEVDKFMVQYEVEVNDIRWYMSVMMVEGVGKSPQDLVESLFDGDFNFLSNNDIALKEVFYELSLFHALMDEDVETLVEQIKSFRIDYDG